MVRVVYLYPNTPERDNSFEFCQGTLMAPEVLYHVIYGTPKPRPEQAERITIRPAVLHGYRRQRVSGADFPAIVPKPSTTVRGVFITGLADRDVACLDQFEGPMYKRRKVKVKLLKRVMLEETVDDSDLPRIEGEEVEAETYVWNFREQALQDQEWDFEDFKERKMQAWTRGPDFSAEQDPGTGGSASGRGTRGQGAGSRGRGTGTRHA